MPRFVLLYHETPPDFGRPAHYDLMLEDGGQLRTWELASVPEYNIPQVCRALAPHRLAYLDYEGPVSGNRGHVRRVDTGEVEWLEPREVVLAAVISGELLSGRLEFKRLQCDDESAEVWELVFRP